MYSDSESDSKRPNGVAIDGIGTPIEPSTPQEVGPYELSQVTLPSTEVPASPVNDANDSFRTEVNDDRAATTIIRSSLTPPPSTQVGPSGSSHVNGNSRRARQPITQSQESNLVSPPATILNNVRERDITDFVPPSPRQVRESSADELRAMLQTCIADHQKLKMETAHHRLQYNLLSLQASEDANRADVELDMLRKEIDALRTAEHSRQAKRELSAFSEAVQTKFIELKAAHEEALLEIEALERRLKNAKRIIGQKDEEVMSLIEERHQLLNRIRENREHMNKLRSPGGIFHGATTPRQNPASPVQSRSAHRGGQRGGLERDDSGSNNNKLTTLLEVLSQDNNSAPSTPFLPNRSNSRHGGKHQRNAQSMSSLPTTPMHRPRGPYAGLLPSANLVPQTEPYNHRYAPRLYDRGSPTPRTERRKSRESTISADDNEELARQAIRSFTSAGALAGSQVSRGEDGSDAYGSQASLAATEMLRREPRDSYEMRQALSRDGTPSAVEQSARLQSKLFSNVRNDGDKRKYGSSQETIEEPRLEQGSPPKRSRMESGSTAQNRMGLGIQYGR
ncbi:uncharacterized protein F5Z01DRAFT_93199 [Emericellopsis atlantica]|uniref:FAD-dependent oxidoreductase-like enzyme n=1 Tax=Emericellopsis atlantica TaxID=2614577 RepID=A0A9P7ZMB0_9HYPO|nr:uncharacterized protein F5Z01DRAFT_93199 [Emericellopsis atlantica]KAG9254754.1 hypothetical protein F5Z01DRAFT_93199 [Emericellopsis atlantica]